MPGFPLPYDPQAAETKLSDYKQICLDRGLTDCAAIFNSEEKISLLKAIFGNSPYLSSLILRMPDFALNLFLTPPEKTLDTIKAEFLDPLPGVTELSVLMKNLRLAKAQVALVTSYADLAGLWPLEKVTETLSTFAEQALSLATAHLVRAAMLKGDLAPPDGIDLDDETRADENLVRECGFTILGMGKLGGRELNYSSDIDLIVLFDQDVIRYTGRKTPNDLFIRMTQSLVRIMQERTADGYVFRTDLRLRPDPGATPVAISMAAAEAYYQSVGLNWERAAMIKARPVAGDLQAGYDFLQRIRGFVWRKHLDFAAIEDIQAIKKLIHKHHKHGDILLAGQDIKLGPGGIREIEFYAQIHQLISGGREPTLRVAPTRPALQALVEAGHLSAEDNEVLQQAYVYFRQLEHRLQMINDDQTHMIPEREADIRRIACFMGFEELNEFEQVTLGHLRQVHTLFVDLLKDSRQSENEAGDNLLSFPPDEYHPDTLQVIENYGFQDVKGCYEMMQNWLLGRYRACRTDRARAILHRLIPNILEAFANSADPDGSLRKFNDFLAKLPSGVQLFSFIKAHPWLLELLAEIMGMAPSLAELLARRPLLLDAVLNADFFDSQPDSHALENSLDEQLGTARDFQDVLDIARKWANEQKFQIGVQILRNTIGVTEAGEALTRIAEVVIARMLEETSKEFARKHGVIKDASFAVLAMGKMGGRELTTTSDLDMVFIYDCADRGAFSDGKKSLSLNHYYARFSQNFINAITAMTAEGTLYEIDMRLRPSGNAGPIAVTLETFEEYQESKAWTWEHMALSRARVIAGSANLKVKIDKAITRILSHKNREQDNLLFEVAKMRNRLREEFGTDNIWAIKHTRGGLVDIEFICQYLLLKHAADKPDILAVHLVDFMDNLSAAGLMAPETAQKLKEITLLQQTVQMLLRLCVGSASRSEDKPRALQQLLLKRTGCGSMKELEENLRQAQDFVFNLYQEMIGKPAAEMVPPDPVTPLGNPVT